MTWYQGDRCCSRKQENPQDGFWHEFKRGKCQEMGDRSFSESKRDQCLDESMYLCISAIAEYTRKNMYATSMPKTLLNNSMTPGWSYRAQSSLLWPHEHGGTLAFCTLEVLAGIVFGGSPRDQALHSCGALQSSGHRGFARNALQLEP
jgi:hypothetical protein